MDWFAISRAFENVSAATSPAFYFGMFGYLLMLWFRRGTWQRMLGRRMYKVLLPVMIFHIILIWLRYIIEQNTTGIIVYSLCTPIWIFNYWWFKKYDDDDDDDQWKQFLGKVKRKLTIRRLVPATAPR